MSIIGALPNNLTNGTTADATQVMADLNKIVNDVNANAAPLTNTAVLNATNNFTQPQVGVNATGGTHFPIASQVQNGAFLTLTSTLGTNTITARCSALPLTAYATGQIFTFVPSQTNTGPSNITVDSAGSSIIFANGATLIGGELLINVPQTVEFDGTKLNLLTRDSGQWVTYTPTITSETGTFTSVSCAGRYMRIGKTYFVEANITITTNGSAATGIVLPLPNNITAKANTLWCGRNDFTGVMLQGYTRATQTTVQIHKYDDSYSGADGNVIFICGTVEAT